MTRTSRYLGAAGAVAAVLLIALVVGVQLGQRQQSVAGPSASPNASAPIGVPSSEPTGSPCFASCGATGTPTPAGSYNDDFGFIVTNVGAGAIIRRESSSTTPFVGAFDQNGYAVSPDGKQIAYWTVGGSGSPSQLKVVSAANPNSLQFSSTLGANERGGGLIWSNDSAGLAYAINTGNPVSGSVVWTVVLNGLPRTGAALTWNEPGRLLQPIAWDRTANVVAAGVTGDGGFMTTYVTARAADQTSQQPFPVTGRVTMNSVRASTDAKFVVGNDIDAGFSYWPLSDFSAKVAPAETKYGQTGALWRPGTHEIGFIGPSKQFWLCNVDRNTPLGCGSTAFSGVPDGASMRLFRADGSAVLLAVVASGSAGLGQTTYTLVKFTGDPLAAKATGGERVTFTDVGGLSASVRLR